MQLFYSNDVQTNTITLHDDEAKHCSQVLRKRIGDTIMVVDGVGNWYETVLAAIDKKTCTLTVIRHTIDTAKHTYKLHIACAPTKNIERFEWFLEKATEIGIDKILPMICQRSERRQIRNDRLEKVILSAMKQSLKAVLPQLSDLQDFQQVIAAAQTFDGQKFIAHCNDDARKIPLKTAYTPTQNAFILIGPEGDFSPEEVALAVSCGFMAISLGNARLRTETAAIAACHTIALLASD
jgi:16S rRNA (uracil1498-N3)-methyltransferase